MATRASTDAREETSTTAVVTSKPASLSVRAAEPVFLVQIREQQTLSSAYPTRYGLPD
jgi:hypothetical protein